MKKFKSSLKVGFSTGTDGITSEHVKYACNTNILLHICELFTYCFKFIIVPTCFTKGLLITILKKLTFNLGTAKCYRPVIVSNMLFNLVELYIVNECNDFHFGFIEGRRTRTAISLAHDVALYCKFNDSVAFMCGQDADDTSHIQSRSVKL